MLSSAWSVVEYRPQRRYEWSRSVPGVLLVEADVDSFPKWALTGDLLIKIIIRDSNYSVINLKVASSIIVIP